MQHEPSVLVGVTDHLDPELQAMIHMARNNNQPDEIRLRQGLYQRTSGTSFTLDILDGQEILLSGGWVGPNDTCVSLVHDPRTTVIDAMTTGQGLDVSLGPNSPPFSVLNITFIDGRPNPNLNYTTGTGLHIGVPPGNDSNVLVERCIFEGNHAHSGSGLAIAVGGDIIVRDNLFVGNSTEYSGAATSLSAAGTLYFTNNTVTGNLDNSTFDAGAVNLYGNGVRIAANNIIAGYPGLAGDADLRLQGPALLIANLVGVISGTPDPASIGNISGNPGFVGAGDYRLRADSRARDAGTVPLGGAGSFDVIGRARLQGAAVDLGAFEFEAVFRNGFEGG